MSSPTKPQTPQPGPTPLGWVGIVIATVVIGLGIWGNTESMSTGALVFSLIVGFILAIVGWGAARVGLDKQEETVEAREYFSRKNQEDRQGPQIQCGKCSHINDAGTKFCAECGNALAATPAR